MFEYIDDDLYLQGGILREAVKKINRSGLSSIVLVNSSSKFIKVISDGDIRRHLDDGGVVDDLCEKVNVPTNQKISNEPLDVQSVQNVFETGPAVKLLPVVSKDGRLVNILTRNSLDEIIPISMPHLEKRML